MSSEQKCLKPADQSADTRKESQISTNKPLRTVTDATDATGNKGEKTAQKYKSEHPTVSGAMTSIEEMTKSKGSSQKSGAEKTDQSRPEAPSSSGDQRSQATLPQSKQRTWIWQTWIASGEGKLFLNKFKSPISVCSFEEENIQRIIKDHEVDLKALQALYERIAFLTENAGKHKNPLKGNMRVEMRDEFREACQKFKDQLRQLAIPNQISPEGIGPRRVLYVSGKDNDCSFRSLLKSAHYSDKRWEEGWSDERVEQEVTSARKHLVGQRLTKHGEYIGLSEPDGRKLIQYFRDKNLIRPELGIRVILHNERGFYGHINLNYSYELSSTEETEMVEQEKIKITINHMRYYWI